MMLLYRYEGNKGSIIKTWPNVVLHTIASGFYLLFSLFRLVRYSTDEFLSYEPEPSGFLCYEVNEFKL